MFITMRMVVVLPAPLGPSRPRTAPWRTRRLTPLTAITDSYDLVTFSSAIASMNSLSSRDDVHLLTVTTASEHGLFHPLPQKRESGKMSTPGVSPAGAGRSFPNQTAAGTGRGRKGSL